MASGARRNVRVRYSLVVDFLSRRNQVFGGGCGKRFWIKVLKAFSQGVQHCWAEHMRNIEHDIVRSPVLDECLQLVLNVVRLLSRQPWDRIVAVKSLRGRAVTVLTVG